ncbi:uncharacterized protein N0V89_000745 [Didymosphaeria variabile]|uniref:HAUS augmin-like complex subunit 6 N-terminal domain-containing protein n=1 Tax=Didymosphaeria variabile TaxID=1932322 RepID=A0A9W9CG52_9PLEO|nr:uncharacterized protein N0V89_000745 [Didymosphaeria variabile]KAJ4360185.1 hypothetical protein N0V89_000745 [Didymosphaeria variabile]
MSRTTSQTSTVSGTTTNGPARSLSLKTNIKPALSNLLQSSDIKLFVTNLRLLDLDRRSDWPKITVQTFSTKKADQRQRIHAVEWALFRLFEIWDPVETSQKLQPFFPPLEPLQSRNLRIALHRSLEALKKDGLFGREAVLRKTMLDECKGDRFYDILASFSAIILKKVVATQPKRGPKPAVARSLATSATLSNEGQNSLLPMAIAHRAALTRILQQKEERRSRFTEFGVLLDKKADEINRRIRKTAETPRASKSAISQKEAEAIKKQLKDNWIGNRKWVDVMLHGDDVQGDAVYLNSSFQKVWHIVEQGGRLEDAVPEVGLLEDLQLRVDEQKIRLQEWRNFHKKMQGGGAQTDQPPKNATTALKDFKFDDHVQLQLRPKANESEPIQPPKLRPIYQDIISEMNDDLCEASSARYNQFSTTARTRTEHAAHSPVPRPESRADPIPKKTSSPNNLERTQSVKTTSEIIKPRKFSSFRQRSAAPPIDSEATLIGQASTLPTSPPWSPAESPTVQPLSRKPDDSVSDPLADDQSPMTVPLDEPRSPSSSPPPPSSCFPSEPLFLGPLAASTEEVIAAHIVSTIGDATPSPGKKSQPRLSLMERTRMSMVRTTSFEPISESPSLPLPEPATVQDKHAALMERTRLSMAAMSSKPRASLASKERKPKRPSQVFPINQFDTPRARRSDFLTVEEETEKTPKESLFSDEVDYASVFKSRPRIATSPVFGMLVDEQNDEDFDEGVTGVDLADVDIDKDEDEGAYDQDSPLRRRAHR